MIRYIQGMAHAHLKRLRFRALRSFAEEAVIDFPSTGMLLLKGHNADTGGSSGSGKSSILLAISYLFGFCRYPGTALQSWLTEDPMEVEGTLEVGNDEVVITRGQKLSVTINGKKVGGAAKQLEEKITQVLGLPPEMLAALTYRGQKQPGLFLSKTDAEKKEFLTALLDLGKFEKAFEDSLVKGKALENAVLVQKQVSAQVASRLESTRQGFTKKTIDEEDIGKRLRAEEDRLLNLKGQQRELKEYIYGVETKIQEKIDDMRAVAGPALAKLEEEVEDAEAYVPNEDSIDRSELTASEAELQQAQGFLDAELAADQERYREQRKHANSVHAQLVLLEKRLAARPVLMQNLHMFQESLAKLEENICDRCMRPWDEAKEQRTLVMAQIQAVVKELEQIEAIKKTEVPPLQEKYTELGQFVPAAAIEELRGIVKSLEQTVTEHRVTITSQVQGLHTEAAQRISQAKLNFQEAQIALSKAVDRFRGDNLEKVQTWRENLENIERSLSMTEAKVQGLRGEIAKVQIERAREQEREAQFQQTIAGLERDLQASAAQAAATTEQFNAELDFQKMIGREGFLGAIFDEVLWEISEETNKILAQFPNTAHVSLYFRSEATTKVGTIKKSIVPVVSIGGFEAPISSGLSGGMETAVELAVDLAVAQVVSRRAGSTPGWLILDESFTGLGPVETGGSMEILEAFASDKLVLVVDHASESKGYFKHFVDVEYKNGFSRVGAAS